MRVRAEFRHLQRLLLTGGVSSAVVARTMAELYDHYEDLEAEALESGCSQAEASTEALQRLGEARVLAEEILRHPEFKSWAFRWAWVPAVLRRFVILMFLVSTPVLVVVARGPVIVRWCVSTGLAMLVTGGLLLLLARMVRGGPGL